MLCLPQLNNDSWMINESCLPLSRTRRSGRYCYRVKLLGRWNHGSMIVLLSLLLSRSLVQNCLYRRRTVYILQYFLHPSHDKHLFIPPDSLYYPQYQHTYLYTLIFLQPRTPRHSITHSTSTLTRLPIYAPPCTHDAATGQTRVISSCNLSR